MEGLELTEDEVKFRDAFIKMLSDAGKKGGVQHGKQMGFKATAPGLPKLRTAQAIRNHQDDTHSSLSRQEFDELVDHTEKILCEF